MYSRLVKFNIFIAMFLVLSACNAENNANDNLINKTNTVGDRWVNYKGVSENDKSMIQSQFIPYDPNNKYEVSLDTYVSYFNGENFIKTELYEDTPDITDTVQEADGIILSFNKENKSGMQLVEVE